jgi:hypothetical protein
MTSERAEALQDAAAALAGALRETGLPHMLIGGLAAVARGAVRLTRDVDGLVALGEVPLSELLTKLENHEIVPRVLGAAEFATQNQVLLLRHGPTKTPIDLSLAWLPYELAAIERAEPVEFAGVPFPTSTPDDLVAMKAVAWRQKDQMDIESLVILHGERLDLPRIRAIVKEFAEVLEAPERVAEFDALIRRARG